MKKLLSLILITMLALSFTACSDDDDDGPTTPSTYKVSGTVTDADGSGVANITVEATDGNETESATTDGQGNYEITGLTASWNLHNNSRSK
ncbi:MAG: carboxypeptidase-like regulatory domain-containing protein [Melioribacteraceae bacterium]|nr:carboxypeptidase-like regulatory domain-containing protein [Melioribacteraceae bacterium]